MFILQIQNSHSASFIYFKLLQVSAMVQASQSGSRCSERFKINFFFFSSNKNISMCFDTISDELNMQTSRLPRRLMYYVTYGFFESNKNKANQKVHPTQKKKRKKYFNSSLWSKVLSVLRRGPSCLLCLLAQCLHCSGERCPCMEPFGFKGQSRPLHGLGAGARA